MFGSCTVVSHWLVDKLAGNIGFINGLTFSNIYFNYKYSNCHDQNTLQLGVASTSVVDGKRRLQAKGMGESESMNWKFAKVKDPVNCRSIRLEDPLTTGKASSDNRKGKFSSYIE